MLLIGGCAFVIVGTALYAQHYFGGQSSSQLKKISDSIVNFNKKEVIDTNIIEVIDSNVKEVVDSNA